MSAETTAENKEKDLNQKFETVGPFGRFIEDCKLFFSLLRDYINGSYRKLPFWVIGAAAATIIYIVNPLDLIPEPIPIIGAMDDLVILGGCLMMIEQELHIYKKWKTRVP